MLLWSTKVYSRCETALMNYLTQHSEIDITFRFLTFRRSSKQETRVREFFFLNGEKLKIKIFLYISFENYFGYFLLLPAVSARPKTISSIWGHIIQERCTLDDVPVIKKFWSLISLNSFKYLSEHFWKNN